VRGLSIACRRSFPRFCCCAARRRCCCSRACLRAAPSLPRAAAGGRACGARAAGRCGAVIRGGATRTCGGAARGAGGLARCGAADLGPAAGPGCPPPGFPRSGPWAATRLAPATKMKAASTLSFSMGDSARIDLKWNAGQGCRFLLPAPGGLRRCLPDTSETGARAFETAEPRFRREVLQ
jgi:hypothetical protein